MASKLKDVIYYIVQELGDNIALTRTKIVKLTFLVDYNAKKKFHKTITGTKYTYYLYGPYSPKIADVINDMVNRKMITEEIEKLDDGRKMYLYQVNDVVEHDISLTGEETKVIDDVIKNYGELPLQELVDTTYKIINLKKYPPLARVLE